MRILDRWRRVPKSAMRLLHSTASATLLPPMYSPKRNCIWNRKERGLCGLHSWDEFGACIEVDCSSCYGWSFFGYLWVDYCVIISTGTNPKAKSYFLFNGYPSCLACLSSIFLLECPLGSWVMLVSKPNPIDLLLLFPDFKP